MKYIITTFLILVAAFAWQAVAQSELNIGVNTTNATGVLPGSIGVSSTGAATYTIPLDMPPGRLGVEPKLEFCYNSQQKISNVMGPGWGLTGFSSITRTNPTPYYNGAFDNIDFDNDELLLDGQHLIKVADNEYRPETDPGTKVVYLNGDYGKYYKVFTKSGMIMEFGNSNDSRHADATNNSDNIPLAWFLNRMYDRNGNTIVYEYTTEGSNGEIHPLNIYYTGSSSKALGSTKIRFEYSADNLSKELRQIACFEKNNNPYLNKTSVLLTKIIITNDDGTQKYAEYAIDYYENKSVSQNFFIKDITLKKYIGQQEYVLNPTHFDWTFYTPAFSEYTAQQANDNIYRLTSPLLVAVNLTGNNNKEVAVYKKVVDDIQQWDVFRTVIETSLGEILIGDDIDGNEIYDNQMYAFDCNGDGDEELMYEDNQGIKIYDYDQTTHKLVKINDIMLENSGRIHFGDFNGDAVNDILVVSASQAILFIGRFNTNGTVAYELSNYTLTVASKYDIEIAADFDGDGMMEILTRNYPNYAIKVYSYNASLGFAEDYYLDLGSFIEGSSIKAADFNGDGKTDILYSTKDGNGDYNPVIYFAYGKGFLQSQVTSYTFHSQMPQTIIDVNADGRADLIEFSEISNNQWHVKYYITQPSGTSAVANNVYLPLNCSDYSNITPFVMDVDDNGLIDFGIAFTKLTIVYGKLPSYTKLVIEVKRDNNLANDVITSVTNGYGVISQLEYGYSTRTSGEPGYLSWPVSKAQTMYNVISKTWTIGPDGNKINYQGYNFYDMILHTLGRGLLGYNKNLTTDFDHNTRQTTTCNLFAKNNKYYQLYAASQLVQYTAKQNYYVTILDQNNTFDIKIPDVNSLVYIPVLTLQKTRQWDIDDVHSYKGIMITEQKIADIDGYGNAKISTVYSDENITEPAPDYSNMAWRDKVDAIFNYDENLWLIAQPNTVKRESYHRPELAEISPLETNEVKYYYWEGDKKHLVKHITETPNNAVANEVNTWYTYDSYGNIFTMNVKTMIDNVEKQKLTTYVHADDNINRGRFLTNKTVEADDPEDDLITSYSYNSLNGTLIRSTDAGGNSTSFAYNHLDNVITTVNPDNTGETKQTGWVTNITQLFALLHEQEPQNLAPAGALLYAFAAKITDKGSHFWNRQLVFVNKYGQELRIVSWGLTGNYNIIDKQYDSRGRLKQVSEPYVLGGSPSQWTVYEYDDFDRNVLITLPTGVAAATMYTGLTVRSENHATGVWKETTMNARGKAKIVCENTGAISYTYDAASRLRKVNAGGAITTMSYNPAGYQTSLTEPNTGTTTYVYNNFGELVSQTDYRNNKQTMQYDKLGRIKTHTLIPDNETTVYTYNTLSSDNGFGQVKNIIKTMANGQQIVTVYAYDGLDRVGAKTESIDGSSYTFAYGYSSLNGMAERYTYPTGYQVTYQYNTLGYMYKVTDAALNVLWQATADNARGQLTEVALGNGLFTHYGYNQYGYPQVIRTNATRGNGAVTLPVIGDDGLPKAVAGNVQDAYYTFNTTTGNLTYKWEQADNMGMGEFYSYDDQLKDRLTGWRAQNNTYNYTMQYAANGNIQTKSDITLGSGQYNYGQTAGPHAVTSITSPTTNYSSFAASQTISFNGLNKVNGIIMNGVYERYKIIYGNDSRKIKSYYYLNIDPSNQILKTNYYFDNFEVQIDNASNTTKYLHYIQNSIGTFAIVELKNNVYTTRYIHTDYQGSYQVISDAQGNKLEYLAYDPWGRRRNPYDWSYNNVPASYLFDRGYTGHEHLDKYGLINMNGRVYDPALGRFLSPDPFVQDATNLQNYNRYSYCLNNPLKYTDPSGYNYLETLQGMYNFEGGGFTYRGTYYSYDLMTGNFYNTAGGNIGGTGYKYNNGFYYYNDQPVSYQTVFNNYIAPNSMQISGSNYSNIFGAIVNGYSIYSYHLFGRENLVSAVGDPLLSGSDYDGYIAKNKTAGLYIGEYEVVGGWKIGIASVGEGVVDFGNYKISSNELIDRLKDFADQSGYNITVVGGDRSPARNTVVGGSKNSRHLHGDAADIVVRGTSNKDVAIQANKSGLFSTTIYYPYYNVPGALHPHVHVDLNPSHNNVLLIYKRIGSSNKYLPWEP